MALKPGTYLWSFLAGTRVDWNKVFQPVLHVCNSSTSKSKEHVKGRDSASGWAWAHCAIYSKAREWSPGATALESPHLKGPDPLSQALALTSHGKGCSWLGNHILERRKEWESLTITHWIPHSYENQTSISLFSPLKGWGGIAMWRCRWHTEAPEKGSNGTNFRKKEKKTWRGEECFWCGLKDSMDEERLGGEELPLPSFSVTKEPPEAPMNNQLSKQVMTAAIDLQVQSEDNDLLLWLSKARTVLEAQ